MTEESCNTLYPCTGNSARSIIAEAIMNREVMGKSKVWFAGSRPGPAPHPDTLDLPKSLNEDISLARSKCWDGFATPDAPQMISSSPSATTPPPQDARFALASR